MADKGVKIRSAGAVILAAGLAKRARGPKAVWLVEGVPSVRRVAEAALKAKLVAETVAVVGGPWAGEIEKALSGLPLKLVENKNFASGQASSLKAGLLSLDSSLEAAVFLLADQPFLSSQIIDDLLKFHWTNNAGLSAPLLSGRRLNPVVFNLRRFRGDLMNLTGDTGGREIIAAHESELAPWPAEGYAESCFADFDTVEDYERLNK